MFPAPELDAVGGSADAEAELDGIDEECETDPEELRVLLLLDVISADDAECSDDDVDALASVEETELCSESQRVSRIESMDAEPDEEPSAAARSAKLKLSRGKAVLPLALSAALLADTSPSSMTQQSLAAKTPQQRNMATAHHTHESEHTMQRQSMIRNVRNATRRTRSRSSFLYGCQMCARHSPRIGLEFLLKDTSNLGQRSKRRVRQSADQLTYV